MTNWIFIYCINTVIININNINNNIYTEKMIFIKISFAKNLKLENRSENNFVGLSK